MYRETLLSSRAAATRTHAAVFSSSVIVTFFMRIHPAFGTNSV